MIAVTAPAVPARDPTTARPSAITTATMSWKARSVRNSSTVGSVGFADQRRAQAAVGKEVSDGDHGGSERDHAEGGRQEQVREHDRADEPDHLGGGRADRQQRRAYRPAFPDRRWAIRLGRLLDPPGLIAAASGSSRPTRPAPRHGVAPRWLSMVSISSAPRARPVRAC